MCPGCGRRVESSFCFVCGKDSHHSIDNEGVGCWYCGKIFPYARVDNEDKFIRDSGFNGSNWRRRAEFPKNEAPIIVREKEALSERLF
jgi:DNA-directed RNA polymerase subunit RPC12/RpoP